MFTHEMRSTQVTPELMRLVATAFWRWYEEHKDEEIIRIRILFVTIVSLSPSHPKVRSFLVRLFGEPT